MNKTSILHIFNTLFLLGILIICVNVYKSTEKQSVTKNLTVKLEREIESLKIHDKVHDNQIQTLKKDPLVIEPRPLEVK